MINSPKPESDDEENMWQLTARTGECQNPAPEDCPELEDHEARITPESRIKQEKRRRKHIVCI
jgi:hypothetical protein